VSNSKKPELSPQEVAWAYCENEATYGYYCNDPECPHCPYYRAVHESEPDYGGALDGHTVTSDADPGL
jgi:hypothetical protein